MGTIQHRITLVSVFTLLVLTIFASSGPSAYGDVLFIGERDTDSVKQGAYDGEADASVEDDPFTSALFADEESVGEDRPVKAKNPVGVLADAIREKIKNIGSVTDLSLRSISNAAVSSDNQWPFAIAGLLFVMLMMRFRRRTKKSKF